MYHSLFNDLAKKKLSELQKELHRARQLLATLPKGHLEIHKRKNSFAYYSVIDGVRKYLGAEDAKIKEQLAVKTYLKKSILYAENEEQALNAYLKKKNENLLSPTQFLSAHPEIYKLISNKIFNSPIKLSAWANAPYDQSAFRPEGLTIRTAQGHLVRSKSECIIANALLASGMPYRYEEASQFNGIELRPDFKIYKENGELFIWEHLGLLDKEEYVQNALWKIKNYISAGFYPGVNLILTADTEAGQAIDSYAVQKNIDTFLL